MGHESWPPSPPGSVSAREASDEAWKCWGKMKIRKQSDEGKRGKGQEQGKGEMMGKETRAVPDEEGRTETDTCRKRLSKTQDK